MSENQPHPASPADTATEPGFAPLAFDGFAGWNMIGSGKFIEIGDGIIESEGGPGLLWYTQRQFADFILRLEWQASAQTDNSGVFIRFPDPGNSLDIPIRQGYEVQIDNIGKNPEAGTENDPLHMTGAIYKLAPSLAAPEVGRWHSFEIEANGPAITVRLDGAQVSRLENASRSPCGYIGLQNHHAGSRVRFARLRIKELS